MSKPRWCGSGTWRLPLAAAIGGLLLAASACSGDGGATRAEDASEVGDALEASLVERDGLTPEDAACVRAQAVEAFSADELQAIVDGTIVALPSTRWGDYTYPYLECVLADDLASDPPTTPDDETAP